MSPLVRSLLALTALLAAVTAQQKKPWQQSYNVEDFGDTLGTPLTLPSIHLSAPGGQIDINIDACEKQGLGETCGEQIEARNTYSSGAAPAILPVQPGRLTPIRVVCLEPDECYPDGVDVKVTMSCKPRCGS